MVYTRLDLARAPCSEIRRFLFAGGAANSDKLTLERQIYETTQIHVSALRGTPLSDFSVNERMRWIATRNTKRKEDRAYCLMGSFNVFIPLIYGEGDKALTRLMDEIERSARTIPPPSPTPSIVIPFRRHRDFIERDVLGEIWQQTFQPAARVGLVGLGGVG